MAVRFYNEFQSFKGRNWRVNIHDLNFSGSEAEFETSSPGFTLQYSNRADEFNSPILGARLKVFMLIQEGDSALETLLTDMVGAQEGRFFVEIQEDTGSGYEIYWAGRVLTDLITEEDKYPGVFEINATDGFGSLKDIPYDDDGNLYTGFSRFVDILGRVVDKTGALAVYGNGLNTFVLRTVVNWWSDRMPAILNQNDPLEFSRLNERTWYEDLNKDNAQYTPYDTYTVVENIAYGWLARMFQSAGRFYFMQIGEHGRNPSAWRDYQINADATIGSTDQGTENREVTIDQEDIVREYFSTRRWFPPYRRVESLYKHRGSANILPRDVTNLNYSTAVDFPPSLQTISSSPTGQAKRLRITGLLVVRHTNNSTTLITYPRQLFYAIDLKLEISGGTDQYLESPVNSSSMTWTTTANTHKNLFVTEKTQPEGQTVQVFEIDITTPEFFQDGWDTNDFRIAIATPNALAFNPTIETDWDADATTNPANNVIQYRTVGLEIKLEVDGEVAEEETLFAVDSVDADPSSPVFEIPDILFGTVAQGLEPGRMQDSADGLNWFDVEGEWAYNTQTPSGVKFNQLLVSEALKYTSSPTKIFEGTIRGVFDFYNTIVLNGDEYAPIGATLSAKTDQWQGSWFQVVRNSDTLSDETPTNQQSTLRLIGQNVNSDAAVTARALLQSEDKTVGLNVTTEDIGEGDTVTSIEVDTIVDATYRSGDVITLLNTRTGESQDFTLDATPEGGTTTLSVSSATADGDFYRDSIVTYSFRNMVANGSPFPSWLTFTGDTGSVTASEPGQTLNVIGDGSSISTAVSGNNLTISFIGDVGDAFTTIATDTGTSPVADGSNDTLTLAGGNLIETVGNATTDTVTFNYTGVQIATVTGDTGSYTAASDTATVNIQGDGTNLLTSVSGNNLTISFIGSIGNAFTTIATDSGTNPVADSATDTLTITGGTDIETVGNSTTDTVTLNYTGVNIATVTGDTGSFTAATNNDTVNLVGGTDIATSVSGDTLTIAFTGSYVDGSGTANYLAKWSDSDTLTDSVIYDNGTNVGIGTATPARKLTVDSGTANIGITVKSTDANSYLSFEDSTTGSDSVVYLGAAGTTLFFKSGGNQMTLSAAGLGVGTTPVRELHLASSSPQIRLEDTDNSGNQMTGWIEWYDTVGRQGYLGYGTTGDSSLYIENETATGSVYIYTNSVIHTDFAPDGSLQLGSYGSGMFTGTATQRLGVDSSGNVIEIPIGAGPVDGSGTANYLAKWSDSDTLTDSVIYETPTGEVGVNTTTPAQNFEVIGDASTARILVGTNANSGLAALLLRPDEGAQGGLDLIADEDNGEAIIQTNNSSQWPIIFKVRDGSGTNEKMRLTPDGFLGIGVTPVEPLQIASSDTKIRLQTLAQNGATFLDSTSYDTSNVSRYNARITMGAVAASNAADGFIAFSTTASNSFNEVMRITSNQRVGIGTPTPADLFHVYNASGNGDIIIESFTDNVNVNLKSGRDGLGGEQARIVFFNDGNTQRFLIGTNTDSGLRIFDYSLVSNVLRFGYGSGQLELSLYGAGTFTGTTAYALGVTAAGAIIEIDPTTYEQNIWSTFNADTGTTSADTTSDTLTVAGGTSISTSITGDTLTITNTSPNVDQNIWSGIAADTGTNATPDSTADTLTFTGGASIGTEVDNTTDTVTIFYTGVNIATVAGDTGSFTAALLEDTVNIVGGTGISTSVTGDTLTITNDSPNADQDLWLTFTADSGSTSADTTTDTLTVSGGTDISTSISGDTLTIAFTGSYVDGSGTANYLPIWTDSDTLGDSLIYQSGNSVLYGSNAVVGALGNRTFTVSGTNSSDFGGELLIYNYGQGSDAKSALTFGGRQSLTEGYTAIIYTTNNDGLHFGTQEANSGFTEPTTHMVLDELGRLGVGITSPNYKLDIEAGLDVNAVGISANGSHKMYSYSDSSGVGWSTGAGAGAWNNLFYLNAANNYAGIYTNGTLGLRVLDDQQIRLAQYGTGMFTGTAAYNLAVDNSGNIIERPGGVVDGSGTANTIPIWTDSDTLGDSIMTFDGSSTITVGGSLIVTTNLYSSREISGSLSGSNWYRIITLTGSTGRGFCNFLIRATGGSGSPFLITGTVSAQWANSNTTLTITHREGGAGITAMRTVRNTTAGKAYVDVLFGASEDNVVIDVLPSGRYVASATAWTNVTTLPSGDAQETYLNLSDRIMAGASDVTATQFGVFSSGSIEANDGAFEGTVYTDQIDGLTYGSNTSIQLDYDLGAGITNSVSVQSIASILYIADTNNNGTPTNVAHGFGIGDNDWDLSTKAMAILHNGDVGIGTSTPNYLLDVESQSGNADVRIVSTTDNAYLRIQSGTDGSAENSGIIFQNTGNAWLLQKNTAHDFRLYDYALADNVLTFTSGTGEVRFDQYGAGTFTGTPTQRLAVDASGNVIEIPIGAGPIDGSGTPDTIPIWTDSDTLGDSILTAKTSTIIGLTASDNPALNVYRGSNLIATLGDTTSNNDGQLRLYDSAGTQKVMIRATGDNYTVNQFGIGRSSAQAQLDVFFNYAGAIDPTKPSDWLNHGMRLENDASGIDYSSGIWYRVNTTDIWAGMIQNRWSVIPENFAAEALTVGNTGNVGVGISAPTHDFHLYRSGTAVLTIEANQDNALLRLESGSDGAGSENSLIYFADNGNEYYFGKVGNQDFRLYDYTLGGIVWGTNRGTGDFILPQYGSGTFTGTAAYNLGVDASGNVIELPGGVVDGSGTTNYVAKWSDSDTLTDSVIYDNGSNVGIGTSSPSRRLHVYTTNDRTAYFESTQATASIHLISSGTTFDSSVQLEANGDDLALFAGNAERVRLAANGNVGVGTTSPSAGLHVLNGDLLVGADSIDRYPRLTPGGSGVPSYTFAGDNNTGMGRPSADTLRFYAGGDRLTWAEASAGNEGLLGVNVDAPIGLVHVNGQDGTWRVNRYGNLLFNNTNDTGNLWTIHPRGDGDLSIGYGSTANLSDSQQAAYFTTTYDIIHIEGDTGNVGINEIAPGYQLDVNGIINGQGNAYFAGGVGIGTTSISYELQIYKAAANARAYIESASDNAFLFLDSGTDGLGNEKSEIVFLDNGTNLWQIGKDAGNDFRIFDYTGGTNVLEFTNGGGGQLILNQYGAGTFTGTNAYVLAVTSSGNVIEVTPSTYEQNLWATISADTGSTTADTTTDTLTVSGGTDISTSISADTLTIAFTGSYVDGSGTANYVSKWSDSDTLTDSVIYDDGTNVGIGTTAIDEKLHVEGSGGTSIKVEDTTGAALFIADGSGAGTAGISMYRSGSLGFILGVDSAENFTIFDNAYAGGGNVLEFTGGTGNLILPAYGSGTVSGRIDYLLGVGPNGEVRETLSSALNQNLWATFNADSGSTTADSATDTLTVTGAGGITTSISGDTLTITQGAATTPTLQEVITAGNVATTAPIFAATSASIFVAQRITHQNDTNTYIQFTGDQIDLVAGGVTFLTMDETSVDTFKIAPGSTDVDFIWYDSANSAQFALDAANSGGIFGGGTGDTEANTLVVDWELKYSGAPGLSAGLLTIDEFGYVGSGGGISDAADVDTTFLAEANVLQYSAVTGEWIPVDSLNLDIGEIYDDAQGALLGAGTTIGSQDFSQLKWSYAGNVYFAQGEISWGTISGTTGVDVVFRLPMSINYVAAQRMVGHKIGHWHSVSAVTGELNTSGPIYVSTAATNGQVECKLLIRDSSSQTNNELQWSDLGNSNFLDISIMIFND